ncbi:MAG TPA: DUF2723 domain-containing protein [Anaerolineae bacterium]|nr:DUF2723 domain-containing protein [Anaerolineae bacterium]
METHTIRRPWIDWVIALLIFVLALAVYNATLTPSLSYKSPDGNELATIPYILGLVHSTGYPLYTWLGKLFTYIPIGDVAHRMNLMSAVLGAAGVAVLYGIVLLITKRRLVAAFTALLFAFSLAFWSQTGITEVYAPNVLMVTLTLWLLLKWGEGEGAEGTTSFRVLLFLAFTFVFGLSLGTHLSNLGFAPAFALYILLVDWRMVYRRPWVLLLGAMPFVLGCLQFLWLPYKASTLNDPLMMRNAPRTLEGIYRYTLGAFPQMKFAFPLWAIPDRIVLYLYLLRQNFGLWGILLGLYGMMEMAFRDVKKFYLFTNMYLVHVFFFVQYRVFDLDAFFIPAHLLYVIFIGYGVHRLVVYVWGLMEGAEGTEGRLWRAALNVGLALLLAFPVASQVRANWEANDYSDDTAINDFYENVWEILPQGSVLVGRGGVFGYDMFYWRLVYNVRPDVLIPMLEGPRPSPGSLAGAGPIYTTQPLDSQRPGRSPWSPPPGLLKPDSWYIPVLLGQGGTSPRGHHLSLTLYRVSDEPPELVIQQAQPKHVVNQPLGGLELVGYDLEDDEVGQGGRLHLTLYWRVRKPERVLIATSLGDTALEAHDLGLGNLQRYVKEYRPPRQGIVVEDYLLVVPSHTPLGSQTLGVSLQKPFRFGEEAEVEEVVELTEVVVKVDENESLS